MIISHKHKFIFFKTAKTASSSVEIELSKICDVKDTITPMDRDDEVLRSELGGLGPRWIAIENTSVKFEEHMHAKDAIKWISEDIWNSYFKFCVERNPWDRLISLYYYIYRADPRKPSMLEFLESDSACLFNFRGWDLYTINNNVVMDRIIRFENLQEELEGAYQHLGINKEVELPYAKSEFRKDKCSYREILTDKERYKLAEIAAKPIAYLGYEF